MFGPPGNMGAMKTTSYKVVLPFYIFAALSFLVATVMLFAASSDFTGHHFQPRVLAITHMMALGWGTMMILGASHQLVPVLIEGKLYSNALAYSSFICAAIGIPLLVYGFYVFDMGAVARRGGELVVLALFLYLVNLGVSVTRSGRENVHAVFVFTAATWLFLTAVLGMALVYNFTADVLTRDSLHYLPLHAHAGIVGWFLLLVIGVASRLIPMFLISKYSNPRLLWFIYALINLALLVYTFQFLFAAGLVLTILPAAALFAALVLFVRYSYMAWKQRLRKKVDGQVGLSLLSVIMTLLPVILLVALIVVLAILAGDGSSLVLAYGFLIFFGWITAMILGMTFKTLPFIMWNKVYHLRAAGVKTPSPKELFSDTIFRAMSVAYLAGLVLFSSGVLSRQALLLKTGSIALITAAALYVWNVMKVITHKPVTS